MGYVDYYDEDHLIKGNSIAVGMMGMQFFYMPHNFYAGQFTKTAFPSFEGFNEWVAQWFISWFNKSSEKFLSMLVRDFEKAFNATEIIVPRKANGDLAVDFIESIVRSYKDSHIEVINEYFDSSGFEDCTLTTEEERALTAKVPYKPFDIVKEFHVANSHNILKSDVVFGSGSTPYVTACEGNNSIVSYISYKDEAKEEGNSIMIGGKTLVITYQPEDFFSNDSHNLVLKINDVNGRTEAAQLFMVATLYKSLSPKYSWGDSISKAKIQKDKVSFPIDTNGRIDFAFMETYIRAIMKQTIGKLKAAMMTDSEDVAVKGELLKITVPSSDRFTRYLPLYPFHIACGALGSGDALPEDGIEGWVDISSCGFKANEQMFVVHAKGESMLPKIKPEDLCVFEKYGAANGGSRDGKIVLVRQSSADDDYGCQYTIKEYHSEKDPQTGRNVKVELRPLNSKYPTIEIGEADQVDVVAVLKYVL
ncbi:MAG: restriction endonuclease subunit S [Paludibacteraceae bacterium]|nr:restriction endonuclease subunit S [Paludibacteraceae bacterium]